MSFTKCRGVRSYLTLLLCSLPSGCLSLCELRSFFVNKTISRENDTKVLGQNAWALLSLTWFEYCHTMIWMCRVPSANLRTRGNIFAQDCFLLHWLCRLGAKRYRVYLFTNWKCQFCWERGFISAIQAFCGRHNRDSHWSGLFWLELAANYLPLCFSFFT